MPLDISIGVGPNEVGKISLEDHDDESLAQKKTMIMMMKINLVFKKLLGKSRSKKNWFLELILDKTRFAWM